MGGEIIGLWVGNQYRATELTPSPSSSLAFESPEYASCQSLLGISRNIVGGNLRRPKKCFLVPEW